MLSLYSGTGGLDLGFVQAGFEIIWANDFEPFAVESYNQNFSEPAICGPIEEQELPKPGSADVVIGGCPCQGYSIAGHMDPADPRSQHVFHFMDIVEEMQPEMFVLENVKALAVNKRWTAIREYLELRAQTMGYHTELFLLNAVDYNVPQARERMFLIGSKTKVPLRPLYCDPRSATDRTERFRGTPSLWTRRQ